MANDNGHRQREPPSDIMTEGIMKRDYAIETGIASTAPTYQKFEISQLNYARRICNIFLSHL